MNRVVTAIAKMDKQIADRIANGETTREKIDALAVSLEMDFEEYVKFQELKSLAVATGKLTLEEGMTIYEYLGNIPDTFNRQYVSVKIVLTKIFNELLSASMR